MNVVSTCLFGKPEQMTKYLNYLPVAMRAHHNLYAGWKFRIHCDRPHDSRLVYALVKHGLVEIALVKREYPTKPPYTLDPDHVFRARAMLWRLAPLWDHKVEYFLSRDIDTIATYRERQCVEKWIDSKLALHAISDKAGSHDWPTLGGMIGLHAPQMRKILNVPAVMSEFLDREQWTEAQWDEHHRRSRATSNNQLFLCDQVWKAALNSACEHRLSNSKSFEAKLTLTDTGNVEVASVLPAIASGSDAFIPFIGSSAVKISAAIDFYKQHGDQEIEKRISAAERDAGVL